MTVPQNFVLCLITAGFLRISENWSSFFRAIIIATGCMAMLTLASSCFWNAVPILVVDPASGFIERSRPLNEDPNLAASFLSVGMVTAVMLVLGPIKEKLAWKVLSVPVILAGIWAVSKTGSRGGMLTGVAALAALGVAGRLERGGIARCLCIAVALISVVFLYSRSPLVLGRVERTFYDGDTASRLETFGEALTLVTERPLGGYGFIEDRLALGKSIGSPEKATHNLILASLLSSGISGAIPFLIAVVHMALICYRNRSCPQSVAAFVWLSSVIVAGLSLNVEAAKWFWLVLGAASGAIELYKREGLASAASTAGMSVTDTKTIALIPHG